MDTPALHGPDAAVVHQQVDREDHERTTGPLLPGLWLATAVGLAVAPFLTQYRVVTPEFEQDYTVDGWGRLDGLSGGHAPRIGLLFAAVAALLILAAVATIRTRKGSWPIWVGLLASTMTFTACVLQLLKLEGTLRNEHEGVTTGMVDVTVGPVAWLMVTLGALAAVAVASSLAQLRRRRLTPRHPIPEDAAVNRPPFALMALWLVAAIGLAVAPFLTLIQFTDADGSVIFQVDGWDRRQRAVGIPCTALAIGLAVAAIAAAIRPAAAWTLRIGVLAGTGALVVAGFQLIILQPILATEDAATAVSVGIGGWLVLAAGAVAAAAVGLTLVRQMRTQ